MRKIIVGIIFCLLFSGVLTANADVAGNIYSTDIKAYINGVEVPSYNIGDKTAIVLEDILDYRLITYKDDVRILYFSGMAPEYIISGTSQEYETMGEKVGKVYKTDIKASIYGRLIEACVINGKIAVALEDLGKAGEFSDIGGRLLWNNETREIHLEFIYPHEYLKILRDNEADITIDMTGGEKGVVEFFHSPLEKGGKINYINEIDWQNIGDKTIVVPLFAKNNNALIGYYFYNDAVAIPYVYPEKFDAAAKEKQIVAATIDDVVNFYKVNQWADVIDRVDTDDFSFLYMRRPNFHSGTEILLLVRADGTYYDFANDFESVSLDGSKHFDNVLIDKENYKVRFSYDKEYVIDIEKGTLNNENSG